MACVDESSCLIECGVWWGAGKFGSEGGDEAVGASGVASVLDFEDGAVAVCELREDQVRENILAFLGGMGFTISVGVSIYIT